MNCILNPLTTDDECTRHVTLATSYQLAQPILDRGFVLEKSGIEGVGRAHSWHAVHIAAVLTDCRKALVATGLVISLLL